MRVILSILGILFLSIGVVGIFVPLLPTTPFLLLAAALFFRSSPSLYEWLTKNPTLGRYITNYRENRAMPLRAKCCSIALLWGAILYSVFSMSDHLVVKVLLLIVAVGVTWHILSLNTTPRNPQP